MANRFRDQFVDPEEVFPVANLKISDYECAAALMEVLSIDRDLIYHIFIFAEDEGLRQIIREQSSELLH